MLVMRKEPRTKVVPRILSDELVCGVMMEKSAQIKRGDLPPETVQRMTRIGLNPDRTPPCLHLHEWKIVQKAEPEGVGEGFESRELICTGCNQALYERHFSVKDLDSGPDKDARRKARINKLLDELQEKNTP